MLLIINLLLLIYSFVYVNAEQLPYHNSTACLDCSNSNICSTIPYDSNSSLLCYQGNLTNTNYDYNYDPSNSATSVPVCTTCAAYNYSYFYRYIQY